jgi:phage terminase Nu1 subunit (DNA packaging protein)
MSKPVEYYDSMKSAAAGMSVPLEILKIAKNMGCDAFRASRVYAVPFRKWLDDNPDALTTDAGEGTESLDQLKKQLIRQQIRRAREGADGASLENQKRRGELIERKNLEVAIPACLKESLRIQRQYLPTDLYNTVCDETRKGFERILSTATESESQSKDAGSELP